MQDIKTSPKHFLEKVKTQPTEVAIRQKELGIWQEYTWQQSYDQVHEFALGLIALGFKRGEHVAAIGDNDREYLWSYLGVLCLGGVAACMFTDASSKEAAYVVTQSDAVFVLAQDQEQVDKILEIREQLPLVRRVIYWDESGLWDYDDDWLISFEKVQALGREILAQEPNRFENEIDQGQSEDTALICYTSGTTGLPKGAMLSHSNLLLAVAMFDDIDPRKDNDNHVSFLPLGWIAEHVIGFAAHTLRGVIINFPEEPETVRENVREIAPQAIVYNSRLWDNLVSMIQVRMLDATWINRQLYKLFVPIGYRVADKRLTGESLGMGLSILNGIGDLLLFGPLRDSLGLNNVRTALTGGAALSPDVIRFFHGIGINLKQVYGSTEVATVGTSHRNGQIKFASVGQPVPGVDIEISDDGEIFISSPTLFKGYYKNQQKTDEAIFLDENGKRWFMTGDAGYIDDDGHVIYLDRMKDMIELSNGERFSPQFIEGRLKFSPYIRDVMTIGDPSRDFVTAMVIIDFDNIGKWAEKRNIGYTTFADLSQKSDVLNLIKGAVAEVNESLPPNGRVQRFVLMHKEFDADESEMTRSRKLRRGVLVDRYHEIIDALYSGADSVVVKAVVTYQDGSTSAIENELKVIIA